MPCILQTAIPLGEIPNPLNSSVVITIETQNLASLPTIAIYDLRGNVLWERSPNHDNRHREMSPTIRTFIWFPMKNCIGALSGGSHNEGRINNDEARGVSEIAMN